MNDYRRVLVAIAGLPFIFWLMSASGNKVEESSNKVYRDYKTAAIIEGEELFNYSVDSKQGKIITNQDFTATDLVSFPELKESYVYVSKDKYEYTKHTYTYECGTTENPRTCTSSYWSWDRAWSGHDKKKVAEISVAGRQYPYGTFNIGTFKTKLKSCEAFTKNGKGGGLFGSGFEEGCRDGKYYTEDDVRYEFSAIRNDFNGSFFVDTSGDVIKGYNSNTVGVTKSTPQQIVESKESNHKAVVTALFIMIVLPGYAALAYVWLDETLHN